MILGKDYEDFLDRKPNYSPFNNARDEGEFFVDEVYFIQYVKGTRNGFNIGIENIGQKIQRMEIDKEGLNFSNLHRNFLKLF